MVRDPRTGTKKYPLKPFNNSLHGLAFSPDGKDAKDNLLRSEKFRISPVFVEAAEVTQFAKVDVAAAPACPNCRQRVTDMNLEQLAAGAEHQCLFCGHFMRVPQSILDRLIAQRDAAKPRNSNGSVFARIAAFFSRLLGR